MSVYYSTFVLKKTVYQCYEENKNKTKTHVPTTQKKRTEIHTSSF